MLQSPSSFLSLQDCQIRLNLWCLWQISPSLPPFPFAILHLMPFTIWAILEFARLSVWLVTGTFGLDNVSHVKFSIMFTLSWPYPQSSVCFNSSACRSCWPPSSLPCYPYLLTVIKWSNCWSKGIPLVGISTDEFAHAFARGWVSHFDLPLDITSYRGCHFISSLL